MNKELFYKKVLENVINEIIEDSKVDIYDKVIYGLSYLSELKDEDIERTIDKHYLKINMTLLDALSLCNDLGVEDVELILKGYGMLLLHGKPKDLIEMIGFNFLESIECGIYNEGYSILVKHIDEDLIYNWEV